MMEVDLKPSRQAVTKRLVESFILSYFDQNPLSQLGIIVTRNSVAEKLTELSGMKIQNIDIAQVILPNILLPLRH